MKRRCATGAAPACTAMRSSKAAHRFWPATGYRLRVAAVMRDYGLREREQAPPDSLAALL